MYDTLFSSKIQTIHTFALYASFSTYFLSQKARYSTGSTGLFKQTSARPSDRAFPTCLFKYSESIVLKKPTKNALFTFETRNILLFKGEIYKVWLSWLHAYIGKRRELPEKLKILIFHQKICTKY